MSENPFEELDKSVPQIRQYKFKKQEKGPREGGSGRRKEVFTVIPGINEAPEERYIVFGQLVINKPRLINDNKLSVKYKTTLGSVSKFKSARVSDQFKDLIKTILEEQKINHRLLSELSDLEKDLFYNLIKRAKLESRLGLDNYRTREQDQQYKRFDLLKGQILAGNNNPKILQELKQLIIKFMNDGTMSKSEGGSILVELLSLER